MNRTKPSGDTRHVGVHRALLGSLALLAVSSCQPPTYTQTAAAEGPGFELDIDTPRRGFRVILDSPELDLMDPQATIDARVTFAGAPPEDRPVRLLVSEHLVDEKLVRTGANLQADKRGVWTIHDEREFGLVFCRPDADPEGTMTVENWTVELSARSTDEEFLERRFEIFVEEDDALPELRDCPKWPE